MEEKLSEYRRKRDASRTPEPVPVAGPVPQGNDDTFVIQEHHASALHWDFRLERDGVLVSWAVPKGLPMDPKSNRLAIQTEDHPLEYASFAADIPIGEYGGGRVTIWDAGHYTTQKWSERELMVVLDGERVQGRFVLFRTKDKTWMMHRMDGAIRDDWQPLPDLIEPMQSVRGKLPEAGDDEAWAFEGEWVGQRAVLYVEGGRVEVRSTAGDSIGSRFPELRGIGELLGTTQTVLDGVIVAVGPDGSPSKKLLASRAELTSPAKIRQLSHSVPVTYFAFDAMHVDGTSLLELPYLDRRQKLTDLGLEATTVRTPPSFQGGALAVSTALREQGLSGIIAKRLDSPYRAGRRSPRWRRIAI